MFLCGKMKKISIILDDSLNVEWKRKSYYFCHTWPVLQNMYHCRDNPHNQCWYINFYNVNNCLWKACMLQWNTWESQSSYKWVVRGCGLILFSEMLWQMDLPLDCVLCQGQSFQSETYDQYMILVFLIIW